MKVTTDAVLLGSISALACSRRVLDIGSGTGILSIMYAQKNPEALIEAIESEPSAYEEAKHNFKNCPWSERIQILSTQLQDFKPDHLYDLIICNPPYFMDSLKSPTTEKNQARHNTTLSYKDLLDGISNLLSIEGVAILSIPHSNHEYFLNLASLKKIYLVNTLCIKSTSVKAPYLSIIQIKKELNKSPFAEELIIKDKNGNYSQEFINLTKDYYLNF